MELFDSHVHLNSPDFRGEVDEVIARAHNAGVRQMLVVGYDPRTNQDAVKLAPARSDLYAAVGIHPHDAKDLDDRGIAELAVLASDPSVVALGEIGLDFYRNLSPQDEQERAFRRQIRMARELDLPMVIHSREAYERLLAILKEERVGPRGGVMHCFASDLAVAKASLDLGLMIGIAGPVTYKRNEELRRVAREIPLDRLLIETDCPYLSPEPFRGKRNEPANVAKVAERIAMERGISLEELASVTTRNAEHLFLRK